MLLNYKNYGHLGVFYSSTLSKLTISITSIIEKKKFIKELYSTENYTQYIAKTCKGKNLKNNILWASLMTQVVKNLPSV